MPVKTRSVTQKLACLKQEKLEKQELEKQRTDAFLQDRRIGKPPKDEWDHYKWVKKNNLLITEKEALEKGLDISDENNRKILRQLFICGYEHYHEVGPRSYGIAPEGYYWKEMPSDIDKDIFEDIIKDDLEFYRVAMCQCFKLAKEK